MSAGHKLSAPPQRVLLCRTDRLGDVILALLLFNLGVEVGQLGCVLIILIHFRILERIWTGSRPIIERYAAHAVGSIGIFWMIERVIRIINMS